MKKMEHELSSDIRSTRQSLRLYRHRLATATSLLVIAVLFVAHLLGALPWAAFAGGASAIVLCVLAFYVAFRSGLNQRFNDQSLTLAQMVAATFIVLATMYSADGARAVFLLFLFMVFLFGVLRFGTRTLLGYAAFILVGYGALIGLLWLNKRQSVDFALEVLQWLALALVLPWFVWMGGYLKGLRRQLSKRNAELGAALATATASESNLAEAQRIARIGMWMIDPVARSISWSEETFRLFGLAAKDGVPSGPAFMRLIHPDDQQAYREKIEPALREGRSFEAELRVVPDSGEVRWLHVLGRPVSQAGGGRAVVRGTLRDITEQREADEHIRRLAHFDGLTGLPNRSLFAHLLARALAQAKRRATPLAVLFIDLDGFKSINDQLGHDAGDVLLTAFATRLTAALRSSDATARLVPTEAAARLGGDEFVVLIDDFTEVSQLEIVARRVLATTQAPFLVGSESRTVGLSMGIALFPQDGESIDTLMKHADMAMYAAKSAGKNTYRYFSPVEAPGVGATADRQPH
jgi:diguanylate cyclase (GGDEF)-like protein/PAS domain S-box-containing protein